MTRSRTSLLAAALLTVAGACSSGSSSAPGPEPAPEPAGEPAGTEVAALFTEAQARRGEAVYDRVCLECHTRSEFTERPFLFAWEGTSVAQVYTYMAENMPDDGPGSLPERQYIDVTAYILELNGYPAGSTELTADLSRMESVPFEGHGSGRP